MFLWKLGDAQRGFHGLQHGSKGGGQSTNGGKIRIQGDGSLETP